MWAALWHASPCRCHLLLFLLFNFCPNGVPQCEVLLYRILEREFKRISHSYARIYDENASDPRAVLFENLQGKCHRPRSGCTVCASLSTRNAHGHVRRAISRENFQEKNAGAKIGTHSLCLRRRNAHGHVIKAISGENLQEKCWDQDRDAQFVLAPSKRTWACHESHFR